MLFKISILNKFIIKQEKYYIIYRQKFFLIKLNRKSVIRNFKKARSTRYGVDEELMIFDKDWIYNHLENLNIKKWVKNVITKQF